MSFVDLNAPSAGELLGTEPNVNDGSKGARNMSRLADPTGNRRRKKGKRQSSVMNSPADDTTPIEQPPKTKYEMRRNYMNLDRETWRSHILDVKNNFLPYRTRWLDDGGVPNRGNKKMQYIVDNCPMLSLRTMSAGLMSGMTSPARPWFRLRPEDDDIYGKPGVAEWCEKATDAVHAILQKSNFYRAMPTFYSEIGAFGTGAFGIYEVPHDPRKKHQALINVQTYTWGEYWISQNEMGEVDTFIRKFKWTVRQVVMKFVDDPTDPNDPTWENLAPNTRSQWKNRQWETWIDVIHVLEPNADYVEGALGLNGMKTRSVYYELGGDPETLLGVRGYPDGPVKVARWDTNSDNVWGYGPAMYCLGDAKQLMVQQKRKMQAIDKQVEPPLIGDAAMKRTTVSQLPGDITWLETTAATTFGLKPLYEVKPELPAMLEDIAETRKRIQAGMYTDIFQMMKTLGDQLKAGITATEIDARKQEQLLELGPLLDRLTGEAFEPTIDQVFAIAVKRSKIAWQYMARNIDPPPDTEMYMPPPPPALQGVKLNIQYISILAQAVRVAEIQGINQVTQYILQLAQVKPEALDKFDFDKAIEIMADRTGVPPECIVSDDVVKQIRDARAKAQQAQQQQEAQNAKMQTAASAAKDLGNTPVGGTNALDQLLNGPAANSQAA
jgi:Bacteriophage head to tail connecting protein